MSWKDIVLGHEKRIQDIAKALHCLKLEVRDLEKLTKPKPTEAVVRCKDCKYWTDGTCEMLGTVHMNADDFCSRGEER